MEVVVAMPMAPSGWRRGLGHAEFLYVEGRGDASYMFFTHGSRQGRLRSDRHVIQQPGRGPDPYDYLTHCPKASEADINMNDSTYPMLSV